MSTDIKHQVMAELLDIHPAALEKAEEQASRIIEMVRGEGRFAPVIRCPNGTGVDLDQYLEEPASVKVQPTEFKEATDEHILEDLDNHKPVSYDYLKLKGCTEFTPEDLSYLKDRGHTWIEIAAEAGITPDAARKRVEKWRAKQSAIEPHIERAWQDAEETIRKPKTVDEFIQERIAAGDMDIEILQAVKRNFPGISMNVADIRSRR